MAATPACQRCAEGRGCGAGLIRFSAARDCVLHADVETADLPEVGQAVDVECRYPSVTRAAMVGYGLPLAAFITPVLLAGAAAPGRPVVAAAAGIAGMLVATLAARRLANRTRPQWVVRAGARVNDIAAPAGIARD